MNRRKSLALSVAAVVGSQRAIAANTRPILVIGATARSGADILTQGLAQGRKVVAFARSPEKIEIKHANLKIVKGDVYDLNGVAAAMSGDEAVVSLLGPRIDHTKDIGYVDIYSVGIATVISAMRRKGNRRLIAVSSGAPEQIPSEKPTGDDRTEAWVWQARNLYGDMQRMEKIIAVSDMETVILRARNFTAGPAMHDLKFKVHDNYTDFDQYKDKSKRTPGEGTQVNYPDFAALILSLVEGGNPYLGKAVGVYSDRRS